MAIKFCFKGVIVTLVVAFSSLTYCNFCQAEGNNIPSSDKNDNGEVTGQTIYSGMFADTLTPDNQLTSLKLSSEVSSQKTELFGNSQLNKLATSDLLHLSNIYITPKKKQEVFFGYLRLVGTTVSNYNPMKNKAVIEDLLNSRQDIYAVDSIIPYGARIVRIYEKEITLEKNGMRGQLTISSKMGNPEDMLTLKSRGYKKVAENEWLIRPNCLIKSTDNIYELLKQISITGRFSISKIKPEGIIRELGFEEGDTISNVNGETIDSLVKAYEVYQRIRKEPVINIGLKRKQQEVFLAYHIISDGPPKYSIKDALWSSSGAKSYVDTSSQVNP